MANIALERVRKVFSGGQVAVAGVDLRIEDGEPPPGKAADCHAGRREKPPGQVARVRRRQRVVLLILRVCASAQFAIRPVSILEGRQGDPGEEY